jgi:hypothetical protein
MQPSSSWQLTCGSGQARSSGQGGQAIQAGEGVEAIDDAGRWPISLPSDLRAEWDLVTRAHHNLLLVGESPATAEMLVAMSPHLRKPVQQHSPRSGTSVPEPSEGTLILSEVASLDLKQQAQLLQWLGHVHERKHVQVVSTTCAPLFSFVESGAFLPALYYRLNVVRIDLTASGEENL